MADNIARTIAALRPYAIPVAVVLRAHYQSVNPEDILALCDAAERGLRVPPREPTQAMMDAARDYMPMGIWPGSLLIRGLWRAMYDASPINEGGQDAAVGNDADARDAVAPSPPVPPSPDGVQSSICPLCDGRFVDLALSRANVVIVRLTRERDEALAECERLRAELLHLVQAYSNRHSPQHRAAALNSAQGLLAAIDAGRRGE